jgi:hypothetical protein
MKAQNGELKADIKAEMKAQNYEMKAQNDEVKD